MIPRIKSVRAMENFVLDVVFRTAQEFFMVCMTI